MPPYGVHPLLKNKAPPSEKQLPPHIETWSTHEMIPRKSTINNNLKSSENPWKMCVKKFIFSKFAGLEAYSRQFYYQINSFTGIFRQHFKLPHASPMCWLKPPCQILKSPPPSLCSLHLWETLLSDQQKNQIVKQGLTNQFTVVST